MAPPETREIDSKPQVLIIGAGIAGLSAAATLAHRKVPVLLVEKGAVAGGKLQANIDADGDAIEHGIHGWWDEYLNFFSLLEQAGISGIFTAPLDRFSVRYPDGTWDSLQPADWPAPFGYGWMLVRMQRLDKLSRLFALRAGLGIAAFDSRRDYERLRGIDLASWMDEVSLPYPTDAAVFEPTIRANLFLPNVLTSAADGINALVRGTRRRSSWKVRWLTKNSAAAIINPLVKYVQANGVDIRMGTTVQGLDVADGRIGAARLDAGCNGSRTVNPAHVILATDIGGAKEILGPLASVHPDFLSVHNLSTADVIVSRLWYAGNFETIRPDGVLLGSKIVDAFLNISQFQPEFSGDRTVIETQTYLARPWMRASFEYVKASIREELEAALPELQSRTLLKHQLLRHAGVFTAFRAGEEPFRPGITTALENLYLAGDWVRTPEPVMFMERAVTAGRRAANEILEKLGLDPWPLEPPPSADFTVKALRFGSRLWHGVYDAALRLVGYRSIGSYKNA